MKKIIAKLSAIVITVVLVAILLSQINLSDITTTLTRIDPIYIITGFTLYLSSYFFRALRFHILLNNKVSIKDLFSIVCVHNMANNILPARTGEVSYVYLSKKLHNIPVGEGVASLMIARIFDFITISFLFFLSTIFIQNLSEMVSKAIWVIGGLLVLIVLLFLALVFFGEIFIDIIRRIANRIDVLRFSLVQYLLIKGKETTECFRVLQYRKTILFSFLISILVWFSLYLMFYVLFKGMGMGLGAWEIIWVSSFTTLTFILPIQGLGGFGTVEGAWTIAFISLGVSKEIAIVSGFSFHIIYIIYFLILGVYSVTNIKR